MKYKDYLPGDYVYGLRASDDYGTMIPPWTLVLSYENAIRKHCYRLSQKAIPFKQALETAWKEPTVRERHYITPLALCAERGYTGCGYSADTAKTGKGKDKGKIKGDGKIKKGRTPDNKPICYRYNGKLGCKKGAKCHYSHVCQKCLQIPRLRSARTL